MRVRVLDSCSVTFTGTRRPTSSRHIFDGSSTRRGCKVAPVRNVFYSNFEIHLSWSITRWVSATRSLKQRQFFEFVEPEHQKLVQQVNFWLELWTILFRTVITESEVLIARVVLCLTEKYFFRKFFNLTWNSLSKILK